jgi:hypothetical protein
MRSIQGSEKEHPWPGSVTAEFGAAHAGDDRVWESGIELWMGFQTNCPGWRWLSGATYWLSPDDEGQEC